MVAQQRLPFSISANHGDYLVSLSIIGAGSFVIDDLRITNTSAPTRNA